MAKQIVINGKNFTSFFTRTGYTVTPNRRMGDNGYTSLDGDVFQDELAVKYTITLPCMPLNEDQIKELSDAMIDTPMPQVYYFNPFTGGYKTVFAYRSFSEQVYRGNGADGLEYWTGLALTLEER